MRDNSSTMFVMRDNSSTMFVMRDNSSTMFVMRDNSSTMFVFHFTCIGKKKLQKRKITLVQVPFHSNPAFHILSICGDKS